MFTDKLKKAKSRIDNYMDLKSKSKEYEKKFIKKLIIESVIRYIEYLFIISNVVILFSIISINTDAVILYAIILLVIFIYFIYFSYFFYKNQISIEEEKLELDNDKWTLKN